MRGLYRSNDGIFLGVCAGLAERFDFSAWGIRLLLLALQFTIFPLMFVVYFTLALVLRRDPRRRWERRWQTLSRWEE